MQFQFHAVDPAPFLEFADLDDAALVARGARRVVADSAGGFPCRVTLNEAPEGARLLLVNHLYLDAHSPYRGTHAIFVQEGAQQARPAPDAVPEIVAHRLVSMRGIDAEGCIRIGEVIQGAEVALHLRRALADPTLAHVDFHSAARGCFLARATRA